MQDLNVVLRKASLQDIDLLIKLRHDYLMEDYGNLSESNWTQIQSQLKTYFNSHIPDGTFIAVIAEINGKAVSAAYLTISEKPANPSFYNGKTATLLNVLTYPEYRRNKIASKVVTEIILEAKRMGVSSVDLLATEDGLPLYEKLGFSRSNYTPMRLKL